MKIAIVHDWLTGMRGGEKCLEILCELYPEADLYTLVYIKGSLSPLIEKMNIKTSFLQKIPGIEKSYRNYLLFMPKAIESFDLSSYDLVISSSHCVAKGVIVGPKTCHISYVHTPVRYAWDMYDHYFASEKNIVKKIVIFLTMAYIRKWDKSSSKRVSYYLANSFNIAGKIKKYYGFDCEVIYPPVETGALPSFNKQKADGYLIVSAFAPYKRIDIAVEAFNELGYPLKIIGKGQDEEKLKKVAKSNITFKGWVPDSELRGYYERCTALIFPGEEDFGIVPVEVQAAGRPVIAYGKGGVLETVVPLSSENKNNSKATGVFFYEQTPRSLIDAIKKFEELKDKFNSAEIRDNAQRFHKSAFREKIKSFVLKKLTEFNAKKT